MLEMIQGMFTAEGLFALATLTLMEVVLGIDNLVFLTILAGKVPPEERRRVRMLGLGLAVGMRVALLLCITWVMKLTTPLFTLPAIPMLTPEGTPITGKSLILIVGGLFLLAKATWEIHHQTEGAGSHKATEASGGKVAHAAVGMVVAQVVALDLVFSLDSVITAVGMVKDGNLAIMITAVLISVGCMLLFAEPLGNFVERHPSIKMLALTFLVLIGVMLAAEGLLPKDKHLPKGYIYFAMAFSLGVELLNLRAGSRKKAH